MSSLIFRSALGRVSTRMTMVRSYTEGSTGAPRSGGEKSNDSFTKREKAQEDLYMRQKEKEKLNVLREALKKQREHLDTLESHINDLDKGK